MNAIPSKELRRLSRRIKVFYGTLQVVKIGIMDEWRLFLQRSKVVYDFQLSTSNSVGAAINQRLIGQPAEVSRRSDSKTLDLHGFTA